MSLPALILVSTFAAACACGVLLWIVAILLDLAADAKEAVEARCERLDLDARLAEREECEALARSLGLLPDPLEALYSLPAREPGRTVR